MSRSRRPRGGHRANRSRWQQVQAGRTTVKTALDTFGKEAEGETTLEYAPDAAYKIVGTDSVGAIAGSQLRNQAVTATLFGLVGILLFIAFRYDWTYAAGAVIAVFHDVLMVLAFFSIFQWEINLTVIAAILTIVGFSVNDSIVIFDRVRENLAVNRTDSLFKITNDSINQTLSRTVITAGLVLLSVLVAGAVRRRGSQELFAGAAGRRDARNIFDDRYREPDRDLVAEQDSVLAKVQKKLRPAKGPENGIGIATFGHAPAGYAIEQ